MLSGLEAPLPVRLSVRGWENCLSSADLYLCLCPGPEVDGRALPVVYGGF